ncbi:hypothetical protein ABG088_03445 [Hydrogenibacillus schlegelii]|nr:hypothetical protein [Hydrogenibacillus schlegelii]
MKTFEDFRRRGFGRGFCMAEKTAPAEGPGVNEYTEFCEIEPPPRAF